MSQALDQLRQAWAGLWKQARLAASEQLLGLAFSVTPDDTPEKKDLAACLMDYFEKRKLPEAERVKPCTKK